jgi:hypothetical protein
MKTYENCPKGCKGKLCYLQSDREHKTCSCGTKWNIFTNDLVINNFVIQQHKNPDGFNLPPNFLQWMAKNIYSGETFFSNNKKECISWAKKRSYEKET